MKTLKILAAFLFVTTVAIAQDMKTSDVPTAVKAAFDKEYPKATDVEWEKKMGNYEVDFDLNKLDHEIVYNASGNVVRKEQDLAEADLPQAIRDEIKSKYAGHKIEDVDMIWENNTITYEVEIEKGQDEKTVTFNATAKVLNERND